MRTLPTGAFLYKVRVRNSLHKEVSQLNTSEIARLSGVDYHRVWRGLQNPKILSSDEKADIRRAISEAARKALVSLESVTFTQSVR